MSECIICGAEHERLWLDEPSMYCQACADVRHDATGTTTHVGDTLYLGDLVAAGNFKGFRLCVHERVPDYEGTFHHIPILTHLPKSATDRTGARVSPLALSRAINHIQHCVLSGINLIVHCRGGVERSPLVVACYLREVRGYTLAEAYAYLQKIRPVVADRTAWLAEGGGLDPQTR
jgi:hypothetical protein